MIFFCFAILCIITMIAMQIYKDIISPAVLCNIPWIFSIAGFIISDFYYINNSIAFLYIIIGAILFQIGYMISLSNTRFRRRYEKCEIVFNLNYRAIKIFIIFEIIVIVFLYIFLYRFISNYYFMNLYNSIMFGLSKGLLVIPGFFSYARNIISIATVCFVLMYFYINENEKKRYKRILIIQAIIATASSVAIINRTGILIYLLPILIIIIISKNLNNKPTIRYIFRFVMVFMVFFFVVTFLKYSYQFENQSLVASLLKNVLLYSSGSIAAFQKFLSGSYEYLYGKNTFRFFSALLGSINGNNSVKSIVQDVISIGVNNSYITNVYTFYHFYAKDFGMVYALFIQFIVGGLHGASYKAMLSKKPFSVYIFSILIYPLIMQFFHDQYLSILSTWLQYLIFGGLFLRSQVFFQHVKVNREIRQIQSDFMF